MLLQNLGRRFGRTGRRPISCRGYRSWHGYLDQPLGSVLLHRIPTANAENLLQQSKFTLGRLEACRSLAGLPPVLLEPPLQVLDRRLYHR
jgi:hypothetical protein